MNNKVQIGSWITLGHFSIAEIMAKAGFDWLCIDLEHSVIDYYEAEQLIATIEANGCVALETVYDCIIPAQAARYSMIRSLSKKFEGIMNALGLLRWIGVSYTMTIEKRGKVII